MPPKARMSATTAQVIEVRCAAMQAAATFYSERAVTEGRLIELAGRLANEILGQGEMGHG